VIDPEEAYCIQWSILLAFVDSIWYSRYVRTAKRACRTSHSIYDRRFHYSAKINWSSNNGWELKFIILYSRNSYVLTLLFYFLLLIRYINRSFTILHLNLSRHYQYLVGVCNDHINIEWQLYSLLPYTIFSFLYYSYTIMPHWFMPKALSESKVIVAALHVVSRKFCSFDHRLYNHVFAVKVGWSQSWNMIWFNKWILNTYLQSYLIWFWRLILYSRHYICNHQSKD